MKRNTEKKKTSKNKRLMSLFLILLLVIGGYFVYQKYFNSTEAVTIISGDFLPDGKDASKISEKDLSKFAQVAVDSSNFNMIIASNSEINASTMSGSLLIQNPPKNAYPVNVEIRLDDGENLIYSSGAIQPGEEIKQVTLDKKLSKGSYKSTATFSLYNATTKEKQGEVSAGVLFKVK